MSLTDEKIMELAKLNCSIHWHVFPTQFARAIEAEATKPQDQQEYGCYCDLGPDDKPDSCVIGTGQENDCCHASAGKSRETCSDWKPIKVGRKKPQEPVGYQELFDAIAAATSVACFPSINISIENFTAKIGPLYTTPQPCLKCAEGMVSVTKEDANNYCRILTLLGMEEEGSPVEGVERLISLRDGMVCGDCNDTGWLENREEGRYPCTCMTEAEPYQILEAKCAELEAKVEQLKMVPMKYRRMEFNAQLQRENMELRAERDALAMQNQQMRSYLVNAGVLGYKGAIDAALALPLPDTSEIIKRHDAAALRKAAREIGDMYPWCETRILAMADEELEKS